MATALDFLHRRHNKDKFHIHRDIKPANILLDHNNQNVVLTDFGIVRAATHVETSSIVAAYGYCAPEQRLGIETKDAGKMKFLITPAIDIYSLGISFHDLLAGWTSAQALLAEEDIIRVHFSQLLTEKTKNKGKVGQLGKVGGLNGDEKAYLLRQLDSLFAHSFEQTQGKTQVIQQSDTLPNKSQLCQQLANQIEKMLSPWPADRPSAAELVSWSKNYQQALNPKLHLLHLLQLPTEEQDLSIGQDSVLQFIIQGQGLPANLQWLQVLINEQPADDYRLQINTSSRTIGFLDDSCHEITLTVKLAAETGRYQIAIVSLVNRQSKKIVTHCNLTYTAQQLWDMGEQQNALKRQIRPEWLEAYREQQINQTNATGNLLSRVVELLKFFQELQRKHPGNQDLMEQLKQIQNLENFKQPDMTKPKQVVVKKRIKPLFFTGLIGLSVFWWLKQPAPILLETTRIPTNNAKKYPPPQPPANLKKPPVQPEKINQRQAMQWLKTGTQKQQSQAFNYLTQQQKHGKTSSLLGLGYAFEKGAGTPQHWGKARQWYDQASKIPDNAQADSARQQRQALDQRSFEIVNNSSEQPIEHIKRAWQTILAAGNAGDINAQLWLGYRYNQGLQVKTNQTEAKDWFQKAASQGSQLAKDALQRLEE